MNATKTISVLVLATASAWSQGTTAKPATKPLAPSAKAATIKPSVPSAKAAATKTAAKPASQMAPATASKIAVTKAAPAAKTAAAKTPKTAAVATKTPAPKTAKPKVVKAKTAPAPAVAKSMVPEKPLGKRDPFVSVIVARADSSSACSGGKRCLLVDQLALRGIVRTPTKWIALVENPARKTYYLYENDPIMNAVVVRITGDSVIFRESVMDALGHSTEREIVKRVSAPAI